MRQLLPVVSIASPTDPTTTVDNPTVDDPPVDPVALYRSDDRPGTPQRPWVAINMVTSLDGATAVTGASAGLSSPADKVVFRTLRAVADVILVGAGTWRAEGYRPPRTSDDDQQWRRRAGRAEHPRIAVVSGRLDLDRTTAFFTDTPTRPIVITTESSDADRRAELAEVADVVVAGTHSLDMGSALEQLGAAGASVVVCEGGPTLNEALLSGSLVDEMCLTLAPLLAGGPSDRAIVGAGSLEPEAFRLDRALEEDGFLVLRYVRDR